MRPLTKDSTSSVLAILLRSFSAAISLQTDSCLGAVLERAPVLAPVLAHVATSSCDGVRDRIPLLSVITKGTCDVITSKGSDDGEGRVIATLGAGDFFGETGLLEGRKERAASVVCTTPVEVLMIDNAMFQQLSTLSDGAVAKGGKLAPAGASIASRIRARAEALRCACRLWMWTFWFW